MTRPARLLACVLALPLWTLLGCALLPVVAAGSDADSGLLAQTRLAQDHADQELAQARTRISQEQSALIGQLQHAVSLANDARTRLLSLQSEAKAATLELTRRSQDLEREQVLTKQLIDRALIASALPEPTLRSLASKPPLERLQVGLDALRARAQELPQRLILRLQDQPVVGRHGSIASVPVLHLGEARSIALAADDDHRGLLERSGDGASWLVVGPLLPASVLPDAAGAVHLVALDVTATAAHQAAAAHRSLRQWLKAGRFFIWPILLVLLCGAGICVERIVTLSRLRVDPRRLMRIAQCLDAQDLSAASQLVAACTTPLDRVIFAGLQARHRAREAREAAIEQALLIETGQLTRGLPALAVLASVAPLLGLLGTVTGMIDMFTVIAAQGSGNAKSLSGGISEALICTQAGMMVAIPLLIAHAWLGRVADRSSQVLEEAACGVLGVSEHGDAPSPAVPAIQETGGSRGLPGATNPSAATP
jgi:biopolymer transport protein ExbB